MHLSKARMRSLTITSYVVPGPVEYETHQVPVSDRKLPFMAEGVSRIDHPNPNCRVESRLINGVLPETNLFNSHVYLLRYPATFTCDCVDSHPDSCWSIEYKLILSSEGNDSFYDYTRENCLIEHRAAFETLQLDGSPVVFACDL